MVFCLIMLRLGFEMGWVGVVVVLELCLVRCGYPFSSCLFFFCLFK